MHNPSLGHLRANHLTNTYAFLACKRCFRSDKEKFIETERDFLLTDVVWDGGEQNNFSRHIVFNPYKASASVMILTCS